MKMLTTYLPPTSGRASVAGHDVFFESMQVRRKLGYLPENVPLYPDMRVEEYLQFRGQLRGMGRSERGRCIDVATEKCWLTGVRRKMIGRLSKGYRQRVGLADALLHKPEVLILDEPTVGLDPTQIIETRKLIKELSGQHTVMLSTHILPEVEAVCSRVIVIAGGQLVADGTPGELQQRSASGRVIVECIGDEAGVRGVIGGIVGAKVVSLTSHGLAIRVVVECEADVRAELAAGLMRAGIGLLELRQDSQTLEQFFMGVIAKQAQAN
jgi:ABC-2 type transport system ATP-binding protein